MNPEQLWETTMNPDGRQLMQVSIEDLAEAERRMTILMGDKVEPRKAYISAFANFNKTGRFQAGDGRGSRKVKEKRHGKKKGRSAPPSGRRRFSRRPWRT